jgi:AcrR family transcriptional regulator
VAAGASASTRDRLLTAAAALLAERGYEAVSIRAVTQAAGSSVSAAHYHFGSKEALVRETLRSRIEPMNARRLALLTALEADGAPSPEAIVEAFLRPALELSAGGDEAALTYRRLPASLHFAAPERVQGLYQEIFGEVTERFLAALAGALPGRDHRDLPLALQLGIGAMVHATGGHAESILGVEMEGEEMLARLARFVTRGILASCPPLEAADAARSPA